jgi:cytochrome c553
MILKLFVWFLLIISLFYTTACSTKTAKKTGDNDMTKVESVKYDKDYATMLAADCVVCHKDDSSNQSRIPLIKGKNKDVLFAILKAFKYKNDGSGTMGKIAKTFSDKELELLSYYFSK